MNIVNTWKFAFHLWLNKTQSCHHISEKREWLYSVFAVTCPTTSPKPSQQNDCLHLWPRADWTCAECSYMGKVRWIWLLGMSCHWNTRLKWSSVQTRIPHRAVVKLPTFYFGRIQIQRHHQEKGNFKWIWNQCTGISKASSWNWV